MSLLIDAGGVQVDMVEQDDAICMHLRAGKTYEPQTLARWSAMCRDGGVVVDVGAYTGLFSIIAARQGCEVIAFEPMAAHVERCGHNFRRNGVQVDLRHACASDRTGVAAIKFNPKVPFLTSGASLVRPSGGTAAADESRSFDIAAVAIDDLQLETCRAIKIDVERGEPIVLAGARKTLARCRPTLLVEVLGESEKAVIRETLPDYRVEAELDGRNWLMVPR